MDKSASDFLAYCAANVAICFFKRAFWQEQMRTDLENWKDQLLIGLGAKGEKHGERPLMPPVVSKDLVVRGEFASQGAIQVDGTIEGDVKSATIRIGDGGSVNGTIAAESVLIAGTVTGKIRSKAVVLARTARVRADLWVDSLTIEPGARFEGACNRFATEAEAREAKPVSPVSVAVAGGRTGEAQPAGNNSRTQEDRSLVARTENR